MLLYPQSKADAALAAKAEVDALLKQTEAMLSKGGVSSLASLAFSVDCALEHLPFLL